MVKHKTFKMAIKKRGGARDRRAYTTGRLWASSHHCLRNSSPPPVFCLNQKQAHRFWNFGYLHKRLDPIPQSLKSLATRMVFLFINDRKHGRFDYYYTVIINS